MTIKVWSVVFTVMRSRAMCSALSLLLTVLCGFFLTNVSSAGPNHERLTPAFDVGDPPDAPFVTRSRHLDAHKAVPGTGLEPKLPVAIPVVPFGAPAQPVVTGQCRPGPRSPRMGACSARGPPRRA